MLSAFKVVSDFEEALGEYTNAPFVVTVDSCTNALFLCCKYLNVNTVEIPKHTYLSVPQSIIHAGGKVKFRDENWIGYYYLKPYNIVDSARLFTYNMYIQNTLMCVSFHGKKTLNLGKGGAILTDDRDAYEWFKMARYDGRHENVPAHKEEISILGYHMYMMPDIAARGLLALSFLPKDNKPLMDTDPDLSKWKIFNE